jgi:hypothetical protein
MNSSRFPALLLAQALLLSALLSASVGAQDRVVVQPRKVVITRTGKSVRGFPERRKATVRYPIVQGLADATALRRLRNTLGLKNVFGETLAEIRAEPYVLSIDYEVSYNKNYLLDITFTDEAEGAYPETHRKHFLINLKNGMVIKAADAFNQGSLATLATLANEKLKAEVKELIQVNEDDKYSDADQKSAVKDQLRQLEFKLQDLNDFSISDKGVTFLYHAGFPHVIRALEPDGEYFFSFAELQAHIKSSGPLGVFK